VYEFKFNPFLLIVTDDSPANPERETALGQTPETTQSGSHPILNSKILVTTRQKQTNHGEISKLFLLSP